MHNFQVEIRTRRTLMIGGSIVALIAAGATPAIAQDTTAAPIEQAQAQADAKTDVGSENNITVTGRRAAEQAALQLKRNSLAVTETIVADDVGKLPDQNVAESVRRLPGLSVANDQGEGRYVIIRGVNPNLVNVTVNGQTQPAPEPDGRQVKLDDIPSSLIAAVTISKSITPDQDANAIGGAVDIRTLSAFDRKEDLFFTARGQYGRYDLGGSHPYEADAQAGGRFGADRQFGFVLSGSYSKRPIESEQFEGATNYSPTNSNPDQFALRDYHLTRKRTGIVANFDWKISPDVSLFIRGTYSKFTDSETRDRDRVDNLVLRADGTYTGRGSILVRRRQEDDNTKSVSGGGSFKIGDTTLDIAGAYASAVKDDPLRSEFTFRTASSTAITGTYDLTQSPYGFAFATPFNTTNFVFNTVNYDKRHAQEDLWQIRADYTIPLAVGDNSTIKIGGKYLNRHKVNDRNFSQFGLRSGQVFTATTGAFTGSTDLFEGRYAFGPRIDYDVAQAFLTANPNVLTQSASNLTSSVNNSLVNDYNVREKITAGYAMATLRFGALTLIPGVRIERTQDATAAKLITATSTATQGFNSFSNRSYTNVFPGLNAKFNATDNLVIRGAITTSLGRPNYPDLSPFVSVDATTSPVTVTRGNPDIRSYRALNLDATAEYYLGKDGTLSVGLFYKKIDNPIYSQTVFVTNGTYAGQTFATANVIQPVNADNATIKGIEFNAQYQFTFLPGALAGFGASANFTIVGGKGSGLSTRAGDLPLFFQSKRIGSAQLTYEKYGISGRVAYSYRSAYVDLLGTDETTDQYTASNGQLDARVGYSVTEHLDLYVEGVNLNDAHFREYRGSPNRIVLDERYGQAFRVGAQVKF